MTRPCLAVDTRLPDGAWADDQIQSALRILSDHHAREWHERASEREAKARQRITDWLAYEAGCIRRGDDYARQAASYPLAHKDHAHFLRLANDQYAKAADARRRIEVERSSL